MEKRCGCNCHIRGIVGFFHCFDQCCDQPDVALYESEAEFTDAHAPRTRLEIAQYIANEFRHWGKRVSGVELLEPLSAQINFNDGSSLTVNGKLAADLNRAPTQ